MKKKIISVMKFLGKLVLLLIFLFFTTNLVSVQNLVNWVRFIEQLEIEDFCIENIYGIMDYLFDWLYFCYFIFSMIYYTIVIIIQIGYDYFLLHWDIILLNCLTYFLLFYLLVTTIFWLSWPLKFFWYWLHGDEEKLWGTNWIQYKKERDKDKPTAIVQVNNIVKNQTLNKVKYNNKIFNELLLQWFYIKPKIQSMLIINNKNITLFLLFIISIIFVVFIIYMMLKINVTFKRSLDAMHAMNLEEAISTESPVEIVAIDKEELISTESPVEIVAIDKEELISTESPVEIVAIDKEELISTESPVEIVAIDKEELISTKSPVEIVSADTENDTDNFEEKFKILTKEINTRSHFRGFNLFTYAYYSTRITKLFSKKK